MTVLGIDFGDRRIGIAKSDALGMLAGGLDTIAWDRDINVPVEKIVELIRFHKVGKVVVGMPRNMDGSHGERARVTDDFAAVLRGKTDVEIIFWDERLTSKSARRTMQEKGIKTGHHKSDVDRIAACYILQSYLDSR
ncbi:MAG: Holliday junction resolvase RuvX [Clostridia bacterium]